MNKQVFFSKKPVYLPERIKDFITNETLWSQPLETILTARSETLKILNNKTKNLDFF
jgi:hypothetical protein